METFRSKETSCLDSTLKRLRKIIYTDRKIKQTKNDKILTLGEYSEYMRILCTILATFVKSDFR